MNLGVKSDKAMNGEEALVLVKQRVAEMKENSCACHSCSHLPYSLIFMDCNMPVMDGFTATKLIKQYIQENFNYTDKCN